MKEQLILKGRYLDPLTWTVHFSCEYQGNEFVLSVPYISLASAGAVSFDTDETTGRWGIQLHPRSLT